MSLAVEPTNQACSDGHKPQTRRMRTGGTATAGNRVLGEEYSRRKASSLRLRLIPEKLCGNGYIFQQQRVIPVCYFAKEASCSVLKEDGELKFSALFKIIRCYSL
ncbi:hypothetical protein EV1_046787 [Malus domestica]